MFNRRLQLRLAFWICAALFILGMGRLFWLRFEAGDVYPPYSSLRSDPLGTQVLYESLKNMPQIEVDRNFRPLNQIAGDTGTTIFAGGLSTHWNALGRRRWEPLLDAVAAGGGRAVFAFTSTLVDRDEPDEDANGDPCAGAKDGTQNGQPDEQPDEQQDEQEDSGLWGLGLTLQRRDLAPEDEAGRSLQGPGDLPQKIVWRSQLFFELQDPAWELVYAFQDEAVVVRRSWGTGDVVMVADSYLFSNEALRNHRYPRFLSWVLRPDDSVVFEEFHHGLSKQPGIAGLIRKYRLHGVVLTLVVLVILMLWRQAAVFVPLAQDTVRAEQEIALGRDTAGGWVSLMQQHIASQDLLGVCHQAWASSAAADRIPREQTEQINEMITQQRAGAGRHQIVAVYRSICELLKQGKTS